MNIFEAIDAGNVDQLKKALSEGTDINQVKYKGLTPLAIAVEGRKIEIAKLLIENGADVGAREEDVEGAGILTKAGNANPILSEAATQSSPEMIELLIKAGADVNAASSGGYTALLVAAGRGNTRVVEALLKAGADANAMGESKKTALQLARERGYTETAEVIQKHLN